MPCCILKFLLLGIPAQARALLPAIRGIRESTMAPSFGSRALAGPGDSCKWTLASRATRNPPIWTEPSPAHTQARILSPYPPFGKGFLKGVAPIYPKKPSFWSPSPRSIWGPMVGPWRSADSSRRMGSETSGTRHSPWVVSGQPF